MRGRMRAAVRVAMVLLAAACGGGGDPVVPDVAPTVSVSASGGSATVAAGSTLSLAARVTDKRAQLVSSPSVVWSSSTPTVAVVSPDGVVTATTVGQTTISAASLGATGTIAVTVTAGAPAKLFIRTQPADVPSGTAFTASPVVEVRDALDNLVTAASVPVTVSFASGVGTIGGATTVTSVQGLATFSPLTLSGLIGPRSLAFSATGLPAVNTVTFNVSAGPAASLAFRLPPAGGGLNSAFTTQPVLNVLDNGGNLATTAALTVTATIASGGGTLTGATAPATNGVVTFTNLGVTGVGGVRSLLFSVSGLPSLPLSITPCDALAAVGAVFSVAHAGGLRSAQRGGGHDRNHRHQRQLHARVESQFERDVYWGQRVAVGHVAHEPRPTRAARRSVGAQHQYVSGQRLAHVGQRAHYESAGHLQRGLVDLVAVRTRHRKGERARCERHAAAHAGDPQQ